MIEMMCECNWGIPGVEKLPAHVHRSYAMIMYDGRKIRVMAHDVPLNPTWRVLDEWDEIHIGVNWKQLARS